MRYRHGVLRGAIAVAATVLGLGSCGGGGAPAFGPDDTSIAVDAGQPFAIVLEENPSIGDDWRLEQPPDPAVAELVSDDYESEGDAPGSGGRRVFTFTARAPGTTELVLFDCYRCGSDGVPTPENEPFSPRITYTVTVR